MESSDIDKSIKNDFYIDGEMIDTMIHNQRKLYIYIKLMNML